MVTRFRYAARKLGHYTNMQAIMGSEYAVTEHEVQALGRIVANLPEFPRDAGFDPKYKELFSSRVQFPSVISHRLRLDDLGFTKDVLALKILSDQIDQTLQNTDKPLFIIKGLPATVNNAATLITILNSLGQGELLEYLDHSALVDTIEDKKRTDDVRPRSSNALPFPIHSDLSFCPNPPSFLYFLMINPSGEGGDALFCDMREVARDLSAEAVEILSLNFPFKAPPHRPDQATLFAPILCYSSDGPCLKSVRYRRDGLGPLSKLQEKAVNELDAKVRERTIRIALMSGEMAIMNNNLVGHGRDEFRDSDASTKRLAVRTNAGYRPKGNPEAAHEAL